MSDTRISAADLLRLAAIASVSPEGTADEVVAILQRTAPAEASTAEGGSATAEPVADKIKLLDEFLIGGDADADSDKLAKPE